ncbi:hypothetical protein F750_6407 [Streptomyces sp. PAMC 26508]|nr:hypothetical protein F750_6407 [Streptomyces sp. PAMC 26508]
MRMFYRRAEEILEENTRLLATLCAWRTTPVISTLHSSSAPCPAPSHPG